MGGVWGQNVCYHAATFRDTNQFQMQQLLLGPYLCFISFLYLDIYGLGDDACLSCKLNIYMS